MNRQQRGFTLIELMISLVLGLAVMAGIMELFSQSQKTYKMQLSSSYTMQDGRYVLEVLSREIRHAGFLRDRNVKGGSASDVFQDDLAVLGSDGISPTINLLQGDAIKGVTRDALAFRYQIYDKNDLDSIGSSSPCTRSIGLNTLDDPTTSTYVVTLYFYVQNDPDDPNYTPVLYCKAKRDLVNNNVSPAIVTPIRIGAAEPLVSNVEKLVIKYAVNDGDNYYYTDADNVTNWAQVVAVKLYILLRSEDDNVMRNKTSYTIEDETYTANDKRLYRVFSTTVAFRN